MLALHPEGVEKPKRSKKTITVQTQMDDVEDVGEIDSQNPGRRQLAFGKGEIKAGIFARPPRLVFHDGRGLSLRTGEPAVGPMDERAKACLMAEVEETLLPR